MNYTIDTRIPIFLGLMQHGDGINVDPRYAVEAENVETPGGVLQPMAAATQLDPVVFPENWFGNDYGQPSNIIMGTDGPSDAVSLMAYANPDWLAFLGLRRVNITHTFTSGNSYTITFWATIAPFRVIVSNAEDDVGVLEYDAFSTVDTDGDWTQYSATVNATSSATAVYVDFVFSDLEAPVGPFGLSGLVLDGVSLIVEASVPKIETLAVLHRRWYTGTDASDDVLVAAAGGVLYYHVPGADGFIGRVWLPLTHPDGGVWTSNTWSWVQYEIAPTPPATDPIDVLVMSNQDDGMIYIRCDDVEQSITTVTTPKKFGVIARYNERIWGGDIADDPDMVVYSAPYDFTDWSANEEIPEDGAGDIQQPTWDGDSFTALKQLGHQLIAFRKNTVWRILGTDPGEFTWKQQYGGGTAYENTIVVDGERVLMLGNKGLLQYDGLTVRPYYWEYLKDFWGTLNISALEQAQACLFNDKYYLAVPTGTSVTNNAVVVYDTIEKTWLLRTDISVEAWLPSDNLYFTNVATPGRIYTWGGGAPVACKWVTPWFDLGYKNIKKGGWTVYLTAEGTGSLSVSIETEKKKKTKNYGYANSKQKKLSFGGSGRRFRLHIESSGSTWKLIGGIQITTEIDPD